MFVKIFGALFHADWVEVGVLLGEWIIAAIAGGGG